MTPSVDDADADDTAQLAVHARTLADAVGVALPRWVRRSVERVLADQGIALDATIEAELAAAIDASRAYAGAVADLLATDIDEQRSTPLTILRSAVVLPTRVLAAAGAVGVERDASARAGFPHDDYDLTPANFADIDPALAEPGMVWGAAKAHVHLARRRREGRR